MNIQLDLRNEADNLTKFQQNFKNASSVKFPTPIKELCSKQILVETFENGVPIGNILKDLESIPLQRRKDIAAKGVDMFLKMIFNHNFVHCDLHPGNILLNEADDSLIIIDPGLTASLTPKDKRNFL